MASVMQCSSCDSGLCDISDCCFYAKGDKQVHLMLRPELYTVPSAISISDDRNEKNIAHVNCSTCNNRVGYKLPFGPRGKHFVAFGCDKVYLFGQRVSKKTTWCELQHRSDFNILEHRTGSNFFQNSKRKPATPVRINDATQSNRDATSSHTPCSPQVVLQNLPETYDNFLGQIVTAASTEATFGEGYLEIQKGEQVQVLYVGEQEREDEDWFFVVSCRSNCRGWIPKTSVVLQNLPQPSHIYLGHIITAASTAAALGEGYLDIEKGEKFQVLYVGEQEHQDADWLFVVSCRSNCTGWIPKTSVVLQKLPTNQVNIHEPLLRTQMLISAKVDTVAQEHGYLALCCGEALRVLYVGSEQTNDAEWLFAESLTSDRTGWAAKENCATQETAELQNLQTLLSQNDIDDVTENRAKTLHKIARAVLHEIAALQATQSAAQNLDDYLPWKEYVAQHKDARKIIGTGIIAATCEYIENEFDHNRQYNKRTDFMFYRTDGTCCRVHPGGTPAQDAKPKIVLKNFVL